MKDTNKLYIRKYFDESQTFVEGDCVSFEFRGCVSGDFSVKVRFDENGEPWIKKKHKKHFKSPFVSDCLITSDVRSEAARKELENTLIDRMRDYYKVEIHHYDRKKKVTL